MNPDLWPVLFLGGVYGFAVGCVVTASLAIRWTYWKNRG